jgi:mannose-6-phosphate isomerase-like protein (cupin superfamily)
VLQGGGLLTLGDRQLPLAAGDTVCIGPGTAHRLRNSGDDDLVVLCCCSPPYSHEDTELLE